MGGVADGRLVLKAVANLGGIVGSARVKHEPAASATGCKVKRGVYQ